MEELYSKYIPPLMNLIYEGIDGEETGHELEFALPRTNLNCLT